jgi:hypothetical protein
MSKLLESVTQPRRGTASIGQLARCVFWGFFGVRKKKDADHDVLNISPVQLIVAGLVGVVVLHLAVFAIVKVIVSSQDLEKRHLTELRELRELRELTTIQSPKLDQRDAVSIGTPNANLPSAT